MHALMTSVRYTQLIDQPTLVMNNSFCFIDLIFASNPNIISNSDVELSLFDKCDHNLIIEELNFIIPTPNLQEAGAGLKKR